MMMSARCSRLALRWASLGLLAMLAACSGAPTKPDPKPLMPIASPMAGRVVWQQSIGRVPFALSVGLQGDTLALADGEGLVSVLQAGNGGIVWQHSLGEPLDAGVGFDGRVAAAVTHKGDVLALDSGGVLWRQPLGVQVSTPPLVAGDRVFVLASDRSVHAFDAKDGRRLWVLKRPGDPLTLLHPGLLRPFGNTLVVGQGGRMVGVDSLTGSVLWETALALPRGTNEIERLADLVGPSARVGDLICARSFQVAIGCINAKQASLVWNRNLGGITGIAADADLVYAADASDRISVWNVSNGAAVWASDALLHRGLSSPAIAGASLVLGDETGVVHFLSRTDGRALLRLETDGSPIIGTPVVLAARHTRFVGSDNQLQQGQFLPGLQAHGSAMGPKDGEKWAAAADLQPTTPKSESLLGATIVVVTRRGGVFALRPE